MSTDVKVMAAGTGDLTIPRETWIVEQSAPQGYLLGEWAAQFLEVRQWVDRLIDHLLPISGLVKLMVWIERQRCIERLFRSM